MKVMLVSGGTRKYCVVDGVVVCDDGDKPVAAAVSVPPGIIFYTACDDPKFIELLNYLGVKPAQYLRIDAHADSRSVVAS